MAERRQWLQDVPDAAVLKSPSSAQERRDEQDTAAGGRHRRKVWVGTDAEATASVQLFRNQGDRRIYAVLRFKSGGSTTTKYIGEATAPSRADALRRAWEGAHEKNLLAQASLASSARDIGQRASSQPPASAAVRGDDRGTSRR